MRQALELVELLASQFPVDRSRLYVTGLSMGGYGVWDAIQRYPDRFAAAVPICGGGDDGFAAKIAHVPIWAFHGARDPVVKPVRSQAMIQAIKAAGGKPQYTEYPNAGHDSWSATYADRKMFQWMFDQRKAGPGSKE